MVIFEPSCLIADDSVADGVGLIEGIVSKVVNLVVDILACLLRDAIGDTAGDTPLRVAVEEGVTFFFCLLYTSDAADE